MREETGAWTARRCLFVVKQDKNLCVLDPAPLAQGERMRGKRCVKMKAKNKSRQKRSEEGA